MKEGLKEFLGQGVRFFTGLAAGTYVGIKATVAPASSFTLLLPTALPGSTSAVTVDTGGQIAYSALSGGGTVNSFSAGALSPLFTTNVATATTTPALTFTLSTQALNTVFAGPPSGGVATPTWRALVANDIPPLTAAKISDFDTQVRLSRLDQLATPTASVGFGGQKGINLLDGTGNSDVASWGQVQALFNGTDNKASARAATTANIALTGTQTIDGVAVIAGDRVLVKNQTTASANGVYTVAAGAWTRTTDAALSATVTSGLFTFVSEGTLNGSNGFTLVTPDPIVLGTTNLTFTQTSGAGQVIAGAGLTKTGNSLDVVGTAARILVNADNIDIDSTYAGQASITTLGTIGTGTWNATAIALAKGGTGATTAAAARAALGVPGIFRQSFISTDLAAGILTVTHNLGQQIVSVQVSDNANQVIGGVDNITLSSTTACAIDLTSFVAGFTGTYNVVVTG